MMNIKKAAELFDLSVDTLRYYERIGVIPPVKRNESGYREYTTADLNWIYLAKFQEGKMNENTIEKLWEKKF